MSRTITQEGVQEQGAKRGQYGRWVPSKLGAEGKVTCVCGGGGGGGGGYRMTVVGRSTGTVDGNTLDKSRNCNDSHTVWSMIESSRGYC